MIKLSIIVVAYRNMKCVAECLASIPALPWIEVIVVDNTRHNRGFGAGCNEGAKRASASTLLFLNPDSTVTVSALTALMQALEKDPSIGIAGPLLTSPTGTPYLSCSLQPTKASAPVVYSFINKQFKRLPVVFRHWLGHAPPVKQTDVGIVSGAAMMMPKRLFDTLGGFDEKFFLYWEEVDLAKRVIQAGYRVVFEPRAIFTHEGETSTVQPKIQVLRWFKASRFYFFSKHFGTAYGIVLETWLTLTEEWRYILAIGSLIAAAYLYFFSGWWLSIMPAGWEIFTRAVPLKVTTAYWLGVIGAVGATTALYNELLIAKRWVTASISLLFGALCVATMPFSLIAGLAGTFIWIITDMANWNRSRKALVYGWVGIQLLSLTLIWPLSLR